MFIIRPGSFLTKTNELSQKIPIHQKERRVYENQQNKRHYEYIRGYIVFNKLRNMANDIIE